MASLAHSVVDDILHLWIVDVQAVQWQFFRRQVVSDLAGLYRSQTYYGRLMQTAITTLALLALLLFFMNGLAGGPGPFAKQGNLADHIDQLFRGPLGCYYYRKKYEVKGGPIIVEHFGVVLACASAWQFRVVNKAPRGMRQEVLEGYSTALRHKLLKGYLSFRSPSVLSPLKGDWAPSLPDECLLSLSLALSTIPDAVGGQLAVHSGRLVFEWTRPIIDGEGASPAEVDAILLAAEAKLSTAGGTLS